MSIASVYQFGTTVELFGVLFLWLAIFLRAPTALRSRQQRMLLLAVIGIAGSVTVYFDPVTAALNRTPLFAQSCGLFVNLWGVLSAAFILDFLLAATSQRRPWLVYGLMTATAITLILLNSTISPHAGCVTAVVVPWYSPFWWILTSAHLVAVVPCAVLCGRYAYRASEDRSFRAGLSLLSLGFTSSSVFWFIVLVFLLFRPAWLGALFPLNIGITAWLMAAGTAVPLVLEVYRWFRNIVALWRLWPLWRYLVHEVPHVALSTPRGRVNDLLGGPKSIYLRLYRRVIEIRDALLILRDYVRPEIVEQARQHVTAHCVPGDQGFPEDQIEPAVTACWLEIAIRAKTDGVSPHPNPLALISDRGADLLGEINFLLAIDRVRKLPLVISFSPCVDPLHGHSREQIQPRSQ